MPTAAVFRPLLDPARYKGAWGGRGSGKSHFFAELLVEDAVRNPGLLAVCIREVQRTLQDSAKRLIERTLERYELGEAHGFRVLNDRIVTPGNGVITFQGMQDHTADSIKSLEGVQRAWVEEAQTLSEWSLMLLRPTIRAEGSELWFSWNPRRKSDPVDAMFRAGAPPTGAVCVRANWRDNPWFPAALEQERQDCFNVTPDDYDHIWEGGYATVTKGAYYARQLAQARAEGRVGRVAADPHLTRRVYVDIGGTGAKADAFSMWVAQFVAREIRVLDYYEAKGQEFGEHVAWLRERDYTPKRAQIWLPHDGATQDRVYAVSYESAFQKAGYTVTVVPNQGRGAASARIKEVRKLFPAMWFNAATCEAGLDALSNYHERRDDDRDVGLGPEHDWASHGADAFGLMAVAYEPPMAGGGGEDLGGPTW
jgi:phage terminase large subunit